MIFLEGVVLLCLDLSDKNNRKLIGCRCMTKYKYVHGSIKEVKDGARVGISSAH